MDEPIFDAMLKNALQEALEEDLRQMENPPRLHLSLRHRWRMRRMLADPWRYAGACGRRSPDGRQPADGCCPGAGCWPQ